MKLVIPTINLIEKHTTSLQTGLLEARDIIHQFLKTHILPYIKAAGSNVLAKLFPFEDLNDRPSVFIQQTWIEKVMNKSQVKDYLWHPTKAEQ